MSMSRTSCSLKGETREGTNITKRRGDQDKKGTELGIDCWGLGFGQRESKAHSWEKPSGGRLGVKRNMAGR